MARTAPDPLGSPLPLAAAVAEAGAFAFLAGGYATPEALADPQFTDTVITRAFTGRPARSLRNRFAARHSASGPAGYPAVHDLTRGLRQAAAAPGDPQGLHLWAGTGFRSATTGPARAVVDRLAGLLRPLRPTTHTARPTEETR